MYSRGSSSGTHRKSRGGGNRRNSNSDQYVDYDDNESYSSSSSSSSHHHQPHYHRGGHNNHHSSSRGGSNNNNRSRRSHVEPPVYYRKKKSDQQQNIEEEEIKPLDNNTPLLSQQVIEQHEETKEEEEKEILSLSETLLGKELSLNSIVENKYENIRKNIMEVFNNNCKSVNHKNLVLEQFKIFSNKIKEKKDFYERELKKVEEITKSMENKIEKAKKKQLKILAKNSNLLSTTDNASVSNTGGSLPSTPANTPQSSTSVKSVDFDNNTQQTIQQQPTVVKQTQPVLTNNIVTVVEKKVEEKTEVTTPTGVTIKEEKVTRSSSTEIIPQQEYNNKQDEEKEEALEKEKQFLEWITHLIAEKKIGEAVRFLIQATCRDNRGNQIIPNILYRSIPESLIKSLLTALEENSSKLPQSVIKDILFIVAKVIRMKLKKDALFDASKNTISQFGKTMNIRKMENTHFVLNTLTTYLDQNKQLLDMLKYCSFNLPKHLISFVSDNNSLMKLWELQSLCAILLMTNPSLTFHIAKFYERNVLCWMKQIDEVRHLALRETSLGPFVKRSTDESEINEDAVVEEGEEDTTIMETMKSEIEKQIITATSEQTIKIEESTVITKDVELSLLQKSNYIRKLDLTNEMLELYEDKLKPTPEEEKLKLELIKDIEQICNELFTSEESKDIGVSPPKVYHYGSSANGLNLRGSDIDICIKFEELDNIQDNNKVQSRLLGLIRKSLDNDKFKERFPYLRAKEEVIRSRVPILKIHDGKRNLDCDICIQMFMGVVNSKLIQTYMQVDDRIKPLIFNIKKWAKQRHINDPPSGSLSSYSYVLMIIQYLQSLDIVPSLQNLVVDKEQLISKEDIPLPHNVNAYNTKYFGNLQKLHEIWQPSNQEQTKSLLLGDLLFGFFEYYATKFNFDNQTISIKNGKPVPKKMSNTIISLEDPFELRDLGGVISNEMGPVIVNEIKRAYEILLNGGKLSDLIEEREGITAVNIYQMRNQIDYEEHIDLEEIQKGLEKGELFKGEIRINKKRFVEAYVTVEGMKKDVLIDGLNARNRAMHGDTVVIKINSQKRVAGSVMNAIKEGEEGSVEESETTKPQEENTTTAITEETQHVNSDDVIVTGTVVAVLKKKSPVFFACTLLSQDEIGKGYRWLIPIDKAYPKIMVNFDEFEVAFNTRSSEMEQCLFVVEAIYPWKRNQSYPKGRLLGTLGLRRDLWSQKRAILLQHLPNLFDNILSKRKEDRNRESTMKVEQVKDAKIMESIQDNTPSLSTSELSSDKTYSNIELNNEEILKEYKDWRNRRIFTIDPTTSRDLDDAVAIEQIEEGKYLVTVAIADVSRFVKEGDASDIEARKRATSVYLVNSVEHMLDPSLSQNLCSLHPGVNRFALSVEFIIDDKCNIDQQSIHFERTLIKSCCRLDYDRVQKIIESQKEENKDDTKFYGLTKEEIPEVYGDFKFEDVCKDVLRFNELAQKVRHIRATTGSIFLANEQLRFDCNENGYPTSFQNDEHNESHILIEEFMLIANELAATALYNHFGKSAFIRFHSSPKREKWTLTVAILAINICRFKKEIIAKQQPSNMEEENLKIEREKLFIFDMLRNIEIPIQVVINQLVENTSKYSYLQRTVQHILLREMQLAQYSTVGACENTETKTWHFALGKQYYTHFTSPIRRYADLIVHRSLLTMLRDQKSGTITTEKDERQPTSLTYQELTELAEHINDQAYRARLAQDDCEKHYLTNYLLPIISRRVERVEAIVLSMGKRAFTVFIPKYDLEVQVNVMKHFSPAPTNLSVEELSLEEEIPQDILMVCSKSNIDSGEEATNPNKKVTSIVNQFTITWTNPQQQQGNDQEQLADPLNRSIELKRLKKVLVDLDVYTESIPFDVIVYNVWEYDQGLKQEFISKKLLKAQISHIGKKVHTESTTTTITTSVLQAEDSQTKQIEKLIENIQKKNKKEKKMKQLAQQEEVTQNDVNKNENTQKKPTQQRSNNFSGERGRGGARGGGRQYNTRGRGVYYRSQNND
ncbi:hypothetical protein ABK040_005756 [Willaertia magna]